MAVIAPTVNHPFLRSPWLSMALHRLPLPIPLNPKRAIKVVNATFNHSQDFDPQNTPLALSNLNIDTEIDRSSPHPTVSVLNLPTFPYLPYTPASGKGPSTWLMALQVGSWLCRLAHGSADWLMILHSTISRSGIRYGFLWASEHGALL